MIYNDVPRIAFNEAVFFLGNEDDDYGCPYIAYGRVGKIIYGEKRDVLIINVGTKKKHNLFMTVIFPNCRLQLRMLKIGNFVMIMGIYRNRNYIANVLWGELALDYAALRKFKDTDEITAEKRSRKGEDPFARDILERFE